MNPPRERAGYVNLKAPRTSYGPRGGCLARREKRELERPRIVQKLGEGYPIPRRTRTDLFQTTTSHCRPCTKSGLPWGAPCRGSSGATPRVGFKRSPVPKNAPCGSGRAYGAPHQSASGGERRFVVRRVVCNALWRGTSAQPAVVAPKRPVNNARRNQRTAI